METDGVDEIADQSVHDTTKTLDRSHPGDRPARLIHHSKKAQLLPGLAYHVVGCRKSIRTRSPSQSADLTVRNSVVQCNIRSLFQADLAPQGECGGPGDRWARGFSSLAMLSCQATIPLSSRTVNHLAERIRGHRKQRRSRWRHLDPGSRPCSPWPTCATATPTPASRPASRSAWPPPGATFAAHRAGGERVVHTRPVRTQTCPAVGLKH